MVHIFHASAHVSSIMCSEAAGAVVIIQSDCPDQSLDSECLHKRSGQYVHFFQISTPVSSNMQRGKGRRRERKKRETVKWIESSFCFKMEKAHSFRVYLLFADRTQSACQSISEDLTLSKESLSILGWTRPVESSCPPYCLKHSDSSWAERRVKIRKLLLCHWILTALGTISGYSCSSFFCL